MLVGQLVVVEDDLAVVLRLLAAAAARGRVRRLHAGEGGGHPPEWINQDSCFISQGLPFIGCKLSVLHVFDS